MMKYFLIVYIMALSITCSEAICIDNVDSSDETTTQKDLTKEKIEEKEALLEDAIDEYKKALKKKKEMMTKLWKTVTKIEFLMKENQVLRKETMKYWEDVKQSHASTSSL